MRACRFFNSVLEHLRHNTQDFKYKLPKRVWQILMILLGATPMRSIFLALV